MKEVLDRKTQYFFGGLSQIAYVLMVCAILIWTSPLFLPQDNSPIKIFLAGFTVLLAGLLFRFTFSGIQINFKQKMIREYTAIFGIKKGKWAPMPVFDQLTLTTKTTNAWNTPNGISPTLKHTTTTYTIALYSGTTTPAYMIQTESKQYALQDAHMIAERLNLELKQIVLKEKQ